MKCFQTLPLLVQKCVERVLSRYASDVQEPSRHQEQRMRRISSWSASAAPAKDMEDSVPGVCYRFLNCPKFAGGDRMWRGRYRLGRASNVPLLVGFAQ